MATLPGGYAQDMSEPLTGLLAVAGRLADRFRSMPQSRLAALAPEGLALARRLARWAQSLEGGPDRGELPEAGIFVVGDQIALAAHDLALALRPHVEVGAEAEPKPEAAAVLADATAAVEDLYRLATTRSARM